MLIRTNGLQVGGWLGSAARGAALALVLLGAEAIAAVHPLDVDSHVNDAPCKFCISIAPLGAAAVSQPLIVHASTAALPAVIPTFRNSGRTLIRHYSARGPPSLAS